MGTHSSSCSRPPSGRAGAGWRIASVRLAIATRRLAEIAEKPADDSGPEFGTAFAVLPRVRRAPSAFLAEARAGDGRGLPRYVEQELRAYLRCGILANGFVRAECKDCGKEVAVALRAGSGAGSGPASALVMPARTRRGETRVHVLQGDRHRTAGVARVGALRYAPDVGLSLQVEPVQKTQGVVVDLCPACAGVQPHWFCDAFADGDHVGSSIVCFRCLCQRKAERSRYATLVTLDDAASMPLDAGLEKTNPELGRTLEAAARAHEQGAPAELILRVESLLFARKNVAAVAESLLRWESLDADGRRGLADDVKGLWVSAGSPARPSTPIQPGMPGWRKPVGEPSVARSLDPSVILVVVAIGILLSFLSALLK